jgi:hypothetical protein
VTSMERRAKQLMQGNGFNPFPWIIKGTAVRYINGYLVPFGCVAAQ